MKILVTGCHVPFISGGASYMLNGLVGALQAHGHQVELLRIPFQFSPESSVCHTMDFCEGLELNCPNGQSIDRVISLQFPSYGIQHQHHIVWLMHQQRALYELFDEGGATADQRQFRDQVRMFDQRVLSRARHIFAISPRVAERLLHFNHLASTPIAHPPGLAAHFHCAQAQPYIFCPSRLESLKRQDLLIEAARHLQGCGMNIIFAGDGGQSQHFRALVARYQLGDRVKFLGQISEAEKIAFYAHSSAVFFAPFDEDYGYITLEAMLSAKPVITCHDSGGPLQFVRHGETGWIVPPEPQQIAQLIWQIAQNPKQCRDLGQNGRACYHEQDISWERTVNALLSA